MSPFFGWRVFSTSGTRRSAEAHPSERRSRQTQPRRFEVDGFAKHTPFRTNFWFARDTTLSGDGALNLHIDPWDTSTGDELFTQTIPALRVMTPTFAKASAGMEAPLHRCLSPLTAQYFNNLLGLLQVGSEERIVTIR